MGTSRWPAGTSLATMMVAVLSVEASTVICSCLPSRQGDFLGFEVCLLVFEVACLEVWPALATEVFGADFGLLLVEVDGRIGLETWETFVDLEDLLDELLCFFGCGMVFLALLRF